VSQGSVTRERTLCVVLLPCFVMITTYFALLILGGLSESKNFLDGCRHVYLDMGTNIGIQIRKLYEPHLFPDALVLPIFDKFFGPIGERDLRSICSVGFEPNPMHNDVLRDLEEKYQTCGWRVYIFPSTGVGSEDKSDVDYVYKKLWEGEDAGVGLTDPLGGMGRFLDKSGIYADDIVEGMMVKVRQLRIANFINNVVAKRKRSVVADPANFSQRPPSVVMKLDVEGRELEIVPDLVMSGALQHIDNLYIDWTGDEWTDTAPLTELSNAMAFISTLSKNLGLNHTTEVVALDDETYADFQGELPQCGTGLEENAQIKKEIETELRRAQNSVEL